MNNKLEMNNKMKSCTPSHPCPEPTKQQGQEGNCVTQRVRKKAVCSLWNQGHVVNLCQQPNNVCFNNVLEVLDLRTRYIVVSSILTQGFC